MSRVASSRKYILLTGRQLKKGKNLSPEQMKFWSNLLIKIGQGDPPEEVLNLKRWRGEKESDEPQRRKISMVLHQVAALCNPLIDRRVDPRAWREKLTVEQAIERVLPNVPKIMGDHGKYDVEKVRGWWYDADKKHMQSPIRRPFDRDYPY